ncbi:MAG: tryptophan 2,3-dioxygenase family protein, partial [Gammaproteobacteria bacterium]
MSERPLTYNEYLGLSSLLDLQRTQSNPPDRDEVLFIVVHQVYELWFKQSLLEIQAVIDSLLEGKALVAMKALKRIHAIFRVILSQIDVLETMTPVDFLNFRNLLGSSSGFQSAQFRCIEV